MRRPRCLRAAAGARRSNAPRTRRRRSSRRKRSTRRDPAGDPGFSFRALGPDAGLTGSTTFGGKTTNRYLLETTGSGVALIDYDADGRLDLFLVNGTTLEGFPKGQEPRPHLYRNRGNGTFEDVTGAAGLRDQWGWGQGACVGDYDNDGHDDLFVTYYGSNRLFHNTGRGAFAEMTADSGLSSHQAAMGHRLRLSRHRPRRTAGSVCRQLHRSRPCHRADARLGLVPVQRRPGRLWTTGARRRQEPAVPEQGRRHVRRRVGQFGNHQSQRVVRARRRDAGLRQRRLDRHLRGQRLQPERAVPQPA